MSRRWGPALMAASMLGCGTAAPGSPTGSGAVALTLHTTTAHFRIFTDRVPDAQVREVADRLEATLPRVAGDLAAGPTRTVDVRLWQDVAACAAESRAYFGRTLQATGYVTGPTELRVLASAQAAQTASHELCHAISLWLDPGFGNNPRWLWESVALFENGERVDPRTLPELVAGRFPTLAQLDADITSSVQIYSVGYLIGESG
jgi:hypothetical protein